uniref:Reelin domain-containing protein n=1 Tax=Parascaris univalens TaxID=6257 RepID=A0A915AJI5_PARUN
MMRHSMRMNRRVHGPPQKSAPPFEFHFLDSDGRKTSYYEPGKIYTVRLVGFVHYRGLLLQSRLTNENGFLLGSLKGGRFIETPAWSNYGIRLQECDLRALTADSVTHSDDSRKFITQLEWTSDKDVGAIQFMLTIAEEDEIYWERWRPRSGFIQPFSFRGKKITIINEVFTDEQAAMRLAASGTLRKEKLPRSALNTPYENK